MIRIDEKLIADGMSDSGGWSAKQLALFGVLWPPRSGWKNAIIGKQITQASAVEFVALRAKRKTSNG